MTGILNVCKVIVAIIGTIVTIVATIIGGLWTYSRFIAEDLPALALRPKMDGKVVWYERSNSDECIAEFNIKLENIGKSAIKLTEASVGAWPLDIPPLAGRKIDYVDVDPVGKIKGIAPIVKGNILRVYLREYYPPGVGDQVGTMFVVKRDPGKMVLFVAWGKYQVETKEPEDWFWGKYQVERKRPEDWFWHQWDEVCGLTPLSKATP